MVRFVFIGSGADELVTQLTGGKVGHAPITFHNYRGASGKEYEIWNCGQSLTGLGETYLYTADSIFIFTKIGMTIDRQFMKTVHRYTDHVVVIPNVSVEKILQYLI
jgi:hypothetical protein